jgi:hypothetical protein
MKNLSFKNYIFILFISLFAIFYLLLDIGNTYAFSAISETRRLGWASVNTFAGQSYSESYHMIDTGGQIGVQVYESQNYKIMAGFGYYYSLIPFSFTIDSPTQFNFEELESGTPQMAYTDLMVTSGAAHGYVVTVYQTHQLEKTGMAGYYIEDTVGDNEDVTHTQEGMWEFNTTYGFGYRLNNLEGTDAVFTTGYRRFADISEGEEPQVIMQNSGVTRDSAVRLHYKINVKPLQEAGYYSNSIIYRCTGTF